MYTTDLLSLKLQIAAVKAVNNEAEDFPVMRKISRLASVKFKILPDLADASINTPANTPEPPTIATNIAAATAAVAAARSAAAERNLSINTITAAAAAAAARSHPISVQQHAVSNNQDIGGNSHGGPKLSSVNIQPIKVAEKEPPHVVSSVIRSKNTIVEDAVADPAAPQHVSLNENGKKMN